MGSTWISELTGDFALPTICREEKADRKKDKEKEKEKEKDKGKEKEKDKAGVSSVGVGPIRKDKIETRPTKKRPQTSACPASTGISSAQRFGKRLVGWIVSTCNKLLCPPEPIMSPSVRVGCL